MTDTPNLAMPFIEGGQAQKHVTHNEALRILDAAVQLAVLDITRTAPPVSPTEGQRHVVATGPTGAWAGKSQSIAIWQDGAWAFLAPRPGWHLWSIADDGLMVFDGTQWRPATPPAIDDLAHVGINTIADSGNRLSVRSDAVLLSHDDVTPGSGHMRMALNKSAAAKDAGVVLQDGFSTRALLGLLGDDNFTLKVSPNGSSFLTALSIDRNSGQASLEQSPKFLVYANFDKYCAANTFTKVPFNNVRHNDQSAFDTTNNQFVVPAAGYYSLAFRVMFKANAAVPSGVTAAIYRNGSELLDNTRVQTSGTVVNNRTMLQSQVLLKLVAGDTIAVWAMMETNDGYIAAAQNSFFGHRIA